MGMNYLPAIGIRMRQAGNNMVLMEAFEEGICPGLSAAGLLHILLAVDCEGTAGPVHPPVLGKNRVLQDAIPESGHTQDALNLHG